MRAVKSVTIDSERRVIITFLDGSTETLYPNCIWCDSEALRQLIKDLLEEKADAIVQTINNVTVATFADGADEALIRKLLVSIEPIQAGTGDPSPENVRPISGWTGLTVYKRGANLIDDSIKNLNDTSNSLYIGGPANAYTYFLKAGTYTLSCDFADGVHYGAFIKETNSAQITIWFSASAIDQATFTLPVDGFYRLWFFQRSDVGGVSVDDVSNIMLNVGDTALPYEPYKQTEPVSVTWETETGTVSAGIADIVNGKLTVNKPRKTFIGSEEEEWIKNISGNYFYVKLEDFNVGVTGSQLCNIFPNAVISSSNNQQGVYAFNSNSHQIFGLYVRWSSLMSMDVAAFKSWLSNNPLTVVYELTEPAEYQLSPKEITTFLGTNNIWADGGNILELEYVADTKLYIGESQSGTLGAGIQSITKPEIQPVSEKTVEDLTEAEEKETQEETEYERGE